MTEALAALEAGTAPAHVQAPSLEDNMARERHADLEREAIAPPTAVRATAEPPLPLFGLNVPATALDKARLALDLTPEESAALIAIAETGPLHFKSAQATLANLFTALIAAWTWQHSHATQFRIGVPFHGRTSDERELIGFKSETLSLRVELDPRMPFSGLVQQVHERLAATLRNRGRSVANTAYAPSYQITSNFKFQRLREPATATSQRIEMPQIAGDPESVYFMQLPSTATPGAIRLLLGLKTPYLAHTTLHAELEGLRQSLRCIVDAPHTAVGALPFIDAQWQRVVATRALPRAAAATPCLFSRWRARLPEYGTQAAIVQGTIRVAHDVLHRWTAAGAHVLRTHHGIEPGQRVLVQCACTIAQARCALAVFAAGGVYVPVSTVATNRALREMAHNLQPALLLTDTHTPDTTSDNAAGLRVVPENTLFDGPVSDGPAAQALADDQPADAPAHIFHTSGTTGAAKAILVSHAALSTSLTAFIDALGLRPGEQIYATYATTFDPWLTALFGALWQGGTFHAPPRATLAGPPADARSLARVLEDARITTLCTPTAYFAALHPQRYAGLRRWVVGGEALPEAAARAFGQHNAHVRLLNAYGPTETTIWASVHEVETPPEGRIPIGGALPTAGFRVASPDGRPTPRGVPGELLICGPQLAVGYCAAPDLTAEAFVQRDGQRWYRTGDLARWRTDGTLDYLGRRDRQVKIRGYRVEPQEIEAVLMTLQGVRQALVRPVEGNERTRLAAYLVTASGTLPASVVALKAELLKTLPDYKVPSYFVALKALPKTANGKIDVGSLPTPDAPGIGEADRMPSLTSWDLRLLFEQVLGVPRVQIDEDFFEAGGDSLSLVQLLAAIEAHFGRQLDAATVMRHPTVGALSPLLESGRHAPGSRSLVLRSGTKPPLFCIPGAGGIGVEFYPLSRRAPDGQPVIVLRPRGTDGHTHPPGRPAELLADLAEQLLAHRPEGPVHLMGYSIGGCFAHALGRLLEAAGHRVAHVYAIDSASPHGRLERQRERRSLRSRLQRTYARRRALRQHAAALDAALRRGRIPAADQLGEYNRTAQYTLYLKLIAETAHFPVTYFRAASKNPHADADAWTHYCSAIEVLTLTGEHTGDNAIVREPNVGPLADALWERMP
jgi:amino acid adenylation domain-containing protein